MELSEYQEIDGQAKILVEENKIIDYLFLNL